MHPFIKSWLKRKACAQDEVVKYVVGPREIMLLIKHMHEGLEKWLAECDFIYEGARQGGHLALLPDLKAKEMKLLRTMEN